MIKKKGQRVKKEGNWKREKLSLNNQERIRNEKRNYDMFLCKKKKRLSGTK